MTDTEVLPPHLVNGQRFPTLELRRVGGGVLRLPEDLKGSFGVVLIYRGSWCPYCNAQLAGFGRAADALAELDVRMAALSVDDEATAKEFVEKRGLDFPVGYGADADEVARLTGAYTNDAPRYLQSTGFVLDPDGAIVTAVYSSGAIGRLVADDVVGFIRYIKSHG